MFERMRCNFHQGRLLQFALLFSKHFGGIKALLSKSLFGQIVISAQLYFVEL